MNKKTRSNLGLGVLLILVGGWFITIQFFPHLKTWFWNLFDWPFYIIGGGICFLIFGLIIGEPGFAIPASIISGIGGLLYYQSVTNDWESWSYAWALIRSQGTWIHRSGYCKGLRFQPVHSQSIESDGFDGCRNERVEQWVIGVINSQKRRSQ